MNFRERSGSWEVKRLYLSKGGILLQRTTLREVALRGLVLSVLDVWRLKRKRDGAFGLISDLVLVGGWRGNVGVNNSVNRWFWGYVWLRHGKRRHRTWLGGCICDIVPRPDWLDPLGFRSYGYFSVT